MLEYVSTGHVRGRSLLDVCAERVRADARGSAGEGRVGTACARREVEGATVSERIAWMDHEPNVCPICGAPVTCWDCKRECWIELHGRILRYAVFVAIVLAACEVAQIQQRMLENGWTPPEELRP